MKHLLRSAAVLAAMTSPASADGPVCGPFADLISTLGEDYGEVPMLTFQSLTSGSVLTLTANPDAGTWTVIAQADSGAACAIDAGDNFGKAPEAVRALAVPAEDS